MRVALLVPGFSAGESDWCIPALLNLVRALARRAEVEVFALRYPHRRDTYRIGEATVHSLGWAQRRGAHSAALWAGCVRAVAGRHRARPFDLLHAFWADEPATIGATLALVLRVPLVASLAGGELADVPAAGYGLQRARFARALMGWALPRAARLTAGSEYLGGLARAHGLAAERAPLGVDTRLFAPAGAARTGAPPALINVGSLLPVKDQSLLLRAAHRAAPALPGLRVRIAGEGPLRERLNGEVARLCLGEHVTLLGELPHEQLPAHYRQADVCVQASLHEAQGMAVLEAAACGVPVVGTAVGVLPELAARGGALATPPGDAGALSGALVALLSDPARRKAMGEAARAAVEDEFAVEPCAARFLRLYDSAAATSRSSSDTARASSSPSGEPPASRNASTSAR